MDSSSVSRFRGLLLITCVIVIDLLDLRAKLIGCVSEAFLISAALVTDLRDLYFEIFYGFVGPLENSLEAGNRLIYGRFCTQVFCDAVGD